MSDLNSQNQDNYDDLLVSIEAGKDILNLLIAVCDDSDCRDRIISDYEAELELDIRRYRVELARGEPSLRSAIANLVAQEAYLQQQGKAVITVTGVEQLRFFKQLGESRSEQEVFFGYLQWTREALREFPFSIVLWVTRQIEIQISNESPDFWSWRKGVFRFETKKTAAITKEEFEPFLALVEGNNREVPSLIPLEDLQDLIARIEHKKGLEDPILATDINNLAELYRSQGRYSEADMLHLQAVEIERRALPEDHPSLAERLNYLALLYEFQGRYSDAEPLYLQAVEIDRRSLPEDHPILATDLNNLALFYKSQGRYSEAEPLYLQAVEIFRRKLPENHPNVLTVWNNYVLLWREGISKGDLTYEQLQEHPFGEQLLAELQE